MGHNPNMKSIFLPDDDDKTRTSILQANAASGVSSNHPNNTPELRPQESSALLTRQHSTPRTPSSTWNNRPAAAGQHSQAVPAGQNFYSRNASESERFRYI